MAATATQPSKAEMRKTKQFGVDNHVHPDGSIRNSKGNITTASYNKTTMKTLSKQKKFNETIDRICGQDGERIVKKLVEIALYDPDMPIYNSEKGKVEKKRFHFYTASDQMKALQIVASYYFGKPVETKQIESNSTIQIEQRVANITKLITQNKEKADVIELKPEDYEDIITDK